ARSAAATLAGLEEVNEGHEVPPFAAALLEAPPLLAGVRGVDRECPFPCRALLAAVEEAAAAQLRAGRILYKLHVGHAVKGRHLRHVDLLHQRIDGDEGLIFLAHARRK